MLTIKKAKTNNVLDGRTLWVPRMSDNGARFFAAVFRSIGIDAYATPESNDRTLELGGLYTSGEECYPSKVTMGDFLRIVHADDFDPEKHAFFMPTANGPCRFGQYAPYLRTVLDELGHTSVPIISPTSENGYDGLGDHSNSMIISLWRGLVCGDILRKLLLKTRPYETQQGAADEAYEKLNATGRSGTVPTGTVTQGAPQTAYRRNGKSATIISQRSRPLYT